jgi:glycosyltransferase involved in cell wall biosynthesis
MRTSENPGEIEISVIVPCYNEEDNIEPLVRELTGALRQLQKSFEIVYVDDGSTDKTADRLEEMKSAFPELRLVKHLRNYGSSAAFVSGFESSTGRILVTLDGDLQNDPGDIPLLLKELEHCDMVCGIRVKRRDNIVRRISSIVANKVRDLFLKDGIKDSGCALRAFKRDVLVHLIMFKGLHRFLPALCQIHGFQVRQIPVNHRPRLKGIAKYGISNRLFVGIRDLLAIRWYRKRHFPPKRY